MGQTVTKNWEVDVDGAVHTVQLRHETFRGSRELLVDSSVVWTGQKFLDDGDVVAFSVGNKDAQLVISVENVEFVYTLRVDGEEVQDMVSRVREFEESTLRLTVPSASVDTSFAEEPVVFYELRVEDDQRAKEAAGASPSYVLKKRFSDFDMLNNQIQSAFAGHHLQSNLPVFPPKYLKLLHDHLSEDFIESRRQELERYMQALLRFPKVTDNPDFKAFVKH